MRTFLLGICFIITSSVMAQRECASVNYNELQRAQDPAYTSRINGIENFILQQGQVAAKQNGEGATVIRIPVVVHVIYKNAGQNISEAQIKSQIDALNRDFRKANPDSINIPSRFKSLAADVQIEFVLATADPAGKATTGILRKQTNVTSWLLDDKIKYSAQGGDNAWDSRFYLNIWVGNLFGLLGFSSLPGGQADKDGMVIHYNAFGTINTAAPYEMGRTVVHEAGHWLGLKHIWGDTYCGDDLVHDTPKQGNFTSGCPTSFRSSCSNGSTGDMYMNYMDYTNDACMNMFTKGQKERMQTLFNAGGPRNSILSSKGLLAPWAVDSPIVTVPDSEGTYKFYPNPVKTDMVINFENQTWIGKTLVILNINGSVQSRIIITSNTQKINLANLPPGLYFIEGQNGTSRVREKLVKL